jgi:shikimate dehydrogenase
VTQLVALLGHPVAHSISPAFQQAALDACGLDARYEAWDVPPAELRSAVERLRGGDLLGANVTVPHKVATLALVDRPDPAAERTGAVNTVVNSGGLLEASNTDVAGVRGALIDAGAPVEGERVVLLGAGGAARAVVVALASLGAAALTVANRTPARAEPLRTLGGEALPVAICPLDEASEELRAALSEAALVIHSTPLGMRHGPDEGRSPLPGSAFRPGQVAFDLVYNPERTPFLIEAERGGARAVGGLAMLMHQGAASFRLWTGIEPPLDVMFEAARAALEGRPGAPGAR